MEGQLKVDLERLMGPLRTRLVAIVEEVGRKEGYSMIFLRNSPGLMYSREAMDVTDTVIKYFNNEG